MAASQIITEYGRQTLGSNEHSTFSLRLNSKHHQNSNENDSKLTI